MTNNSKYVNTNNYINQQGSILNTKSNNNQDKDFKTHAIELESQINLLKKKLLISENNLKNSLLENPHFNRLHEESKNSLYETILIYLKNVNIQHLLEIYKLNLQKEDELNKVANSQKKIPGANDFALNLKNLSEKLFHLTKHCELAFNDYENRSKSYISIDDLEKKLNDYKNFIEQNLNDFLSLLVSHMINNSEFVIFKLNHKDYNQALENISMNLENYNKMNFEIIENQRRNFYSLQSALEIIQKQAKIEYENVRSIIYEDNLKFI